MVRMMIGAAVAAGMALAGPAMAADKDVWCAYKAAKDALSQEANTHPELVAASATDTGWMERREAWIGPRIAALQAKHFGGAEAAKAASIAQARERWDCRK